MFYSLLNIYYAFNKSMMKNNACIYVLKKKIKTKQKEKKTIKLSFFSNIQF